MNKIKIGTQESMKELFLSKKDKVLEYWHEFLSIKQIIDHCKFSPGMKVLDIGGGITSILHFLLSTQNTLIDPLINDYKEVYEKTEIELVEGYGENLPFTENSFDVVFCTNVIDYSKDPLKIMREAKRVLKEDGKFVLIFKEDKKLEKKLKLREWGIEYISMFKWIGLKNYLLDILPYKKEQGRLFILSPKVKKFDKIENFNYQTRARFEEMLNLIGDASGKISLNIGVGPYQLVKNAKTLDILPELKPDILYDLNNTKEKIPLEDNSIDIIIAGEVIEHIRYPIFFLDECRRILKEDGKMVLSTPNICSLKNRFKMLFGQLPQHCCYPIYERKENYGHVKDFNLDALKKLFKLANLNLEKVRTNGIVIRQIPIFPRRFLPVTFGECFIIELKKETKK